MRCDLEGTFEDIITRDMKNPSLTAKVFPVMKMKVHPGRSCPLLNYKNIKEKGYLKKSLKTTQFVASILKRKEDNQIDPINSEIKTSLNLATSSPNVKFSSIHRKVIEIREIA